MTSVNILVMRDLPRAIKKHLDNFTKSTEWYLHVDRNTDNSFCCLQAPSVHHGMVWIFFSTFEIPGPKAQIDTLYGEPFEVILLAETEQQPDQIWKRFASNSARWKIEKTQSPYRLFQSILGEIADFAYTKKEAEGILNEVYNRSLSAARNDEEVDCQITVEKMTDASGLKELCFMSGYEREMRFHVHDAWEYIVGTAKKSKYKTVYIAYMSKKSDDKPIPVGYIAALDGDWPIIRSKFDFMKEGQLKIISFAVIPEMRRRKVATLLFQKLLFDNKGKNSIDVAIEYNNIDALKLMQSLKFKSPSATQSGEHIIWTETNPESLLHN